LFRQAEQDYLAAFRSYFEHEVGTLPDDRFWELQAVLREEVSTFRFTYGRTNGIEQGAQEFFRKPLAGDFGNRPRYTSAEATCFAKTWRMCRNRLYQPLFDVVTDRGDDAYGDLLDALPFAGRDVMARCLDREIGSERQFEAAVLAGCGGHQQLADLILHGENYVGMALYDAAQRYFAVDL